MKTIAQQLSIKDFPFIIKDKNGNRIYFECSDGYWVKREYDSKGKVIYCEDSEGYWVKREYDSNGNKTYFENSHKTIINNRPKTTFTMKEIAQKLGVAIEALQIKD